MSTRASGPWCSRPSVLDMAVHVPDDGKVQVNWTLASVKDY